MCNLKPVLVAFSLGLWLTPTATQAVVVAIGDSVSGFQSRSSFYGQNTGRLYSNPDEVGFFVTESAETTDEAYIHWLGISHDDLKEAPHSLLLVPSRRPESQTSAIAPVPEPAEWFYGAAGMTLLIVHRERLVRHAGNCNENGKGMI